MHLMVTQNYDMLSQAAARLLAARQVIVLVSGGQKRDILQRTLKGPVTPDVPASYLQASSSVIIIADAAAWPQSVPGNILAV